jgi:hypothetical protein
MNHKFDGYEADWGRIVATMWVAKTSTAYLFREPCVYIRLYVPNDSDILAFKREILISTSSIEYTSQI